VYNAHNKFNENSVFIDLIQFLPVVLYGCETWSLTSREEHGLRVFENRVLRRIFRPKREVDGSWRKMHNDEFHSLYSSLNIVRVIKSRWLGHVARMGEVFTGFWLGVPKVRDHWEYLGVGGRITLNWTLRRHGSMGRASFGWLRIESSGGLV
jgi:hypothetical protein